MKCYRYKYNDTVQSTCTGSFEQCKELVECPSDSKQYKPVCFALAKLDDDYLKQYFPTSSSNQSTGTSSGKTTTTTTTTPNSLVAPKPKTIILNAGCYSHDIVSEVCSSNQCYGNYRASAKNYYCCCTETGCNDELIPKQLPPLNNNNDPHQSQIGAPASPAPSTTGSILMTNLSVMFLAVILFLIVSLLFAIYHRRKLRHPRRHHGTSNNYRGNNHHQLNSWAGNANKDDNNLAAADPILMPLRNSFIDDGNNYQFGQQAGETDQNLGRGDHHTVRTDHASATNNPALGRDGVHQVGELKYDLKDIKLLEMVGSGRFGMVHRAYLLRMSQGLETGSNDDNNNSNSFPIENSSAPSIEAREGNQENHINNDQSDEVNHQQYEEHSEIAVKIIPNNEYQSFQNELRIYNSSKTRHPNILTFIGSCESPRTNSNWLLVEYASNGSLHHYLKEHPVTWEEFLMISLGIVRGLSHLHDADIAHRDFKSKNVLLRHKLRPCITDFGVASMLDSTGGSHNEQRKKYLQVGTPRYMAPEVLECSVAFTKASFTKIDVYALSLVLWELLWRCHPLPKLIYHAADYGQQQQQQQLQSMLDHRNDVVPPHGVPFEDVVGPNPDINAMRQVVVNDKIRPPIRPEWRFYPIAKLCQAIVDGWEYDHDARISASCFVERIETMIQQQHEHHIPPPAVGQSNKAK